MNIYNDAFYGYTTNYALEKKTYPGFNNAAGLHMNYGAVNLIQSDPSLLVQLPSMDSLWLSGSQIGSSEPAGC